MRGRLPPDKLVLLHGVSGVAFLIGAAWYLFEIAQGVINHDEFLGGIDHNVATWLHAHATPALTTAMIIISYLGAPVTSLSIGAISVVALWRRGQRYAVLLILLAVPCGALLNVMMKLAIARERPTFADPIITLVSYSFPSGHAIGATLLYGILAVIIVRTMRDTHLRTLTILAAALLILLVCFSRIYLGVHYLSDVVAGVLAGIAWILLCIFAVAALRRYRMRRARRDSRRQPS